MHMVVVSLVDTQLCSCFMLTPVQMCRCAAEQHEASDVCSCNTWFKTALILFSPISSCVSAAACTNHVPVITTLLRGGETQVLKCLVCRFCGAVSKNMCVHDTVQKPPRTNQQGGRYFFTALQFSWLVQIVKKQLAQCFCPCCCLAVFYSLVFAGVLLYVKYLNTF